MNNEIENDGDDGDDDEEEEEQEEQEEEQEQGACHRLGDLSRQSEAGDGRARETVDQLPLHFHVGLHPPKKSNKTEIKSNKNIYEPLFKKRTSDVSLPMGRERGWGTNWSRCTSLRPPDRNRRFAVYSSAWSYCRQRLRWYRWKEGWPRSGYHVLPSWRCWCWRLLKFNVRVMHFVPGFG